MKKNSESIPNGQGPVSDATEAEKPIEWTVATIEKMVSRDLQGCLNLLSAIQQDKELRLHMATFMLGRLTNSQHKPDPAQINLGL